MISRIFPFLTWFKGYDGGKFRDDLLAGITVALVLIPQSMAYAQLAGLPAYYGLYAAFLPPMVASLFGSSRQLATGPVAVVSLMSAATLEPLATAGGEAFIAYSILLALIVGIFQFTLGLLRLGAVVNLLAHPVVIGFTNAAAIIIATSQLSKLFGVYVDKSEHHYETIINVIKAAFEYTHLPTLALGVLAFTIMVVLKRINPKIPNVLVAVVVTILISWGIGFEKKANIKISAIKYEAAIEKIRGFNESVTELEAMAITRTSINPELEKAIKEHGEHSLEVNEISHRLNTVNLQMDEMKEKVRKYRKELRGLHFNAVKEKDESVILFKKGEIPAGKEKEGGIWRLKVGNTALNEDSLNVAGGGAVVGTIPEGLPKISIPSIDFSMVLRLFSAAVIISLLGFMEAISIAKAMAVRTGQRLDPNQELIGQGLANILGSFGQSYAISGSFSRSAVNIQAGAFSGLSSVFTSCVVIITLLFFTPLLYHLPQAVLAAVIMMAVVGLVNVKSMMHSWHAQRYDGVAAVMTFFFTLAFAPHLDKGIMIGVLFTVGHYVYRTMKPRVAVLSKGDDNTLKDIEMYNLPTCIHTSIIRFDGSLIFANTSYLEDQILERLSVKPHLKAVVLVADGINELDASGEDMLSNLISRFREREIEVYFCGLKEQVLEVMKHTGAIKKLSEANLFTSPYRVLRAIYPKLHANSDEKNCPLRELAYQTRVLLVDDESDYALTLSKRLQLRNIESHVVNDGNSALDFIKNEGPEVIVLDINLPDISGLEVLKTAREEEPHLKVIIITGEEGDKVQKDVDEAGAFAFLRKPFDLNDLLKTINDAYDKINEEHKAAM